MIVVTGGSGFIGTHLCKLLSSQGHEVRVIDLMPPPFGIKAEFVRASVLDTARLSKLFDGAKSVVHLAALVDVQSSLSDPFSDFQVNVQGTLNVLEVARRAGIKKVAYASSAAVYGEPEALPIIESHSTLPISPYGLSKLSSERYVLLYNKLYGMENVALRLFNIYGTGQHEGSPYSGVITKFAEAIHSGKQPLIYGTGKQTRDFLHADDVAHAFLLALESDGCDTPLNIGSGKEVSIIDLLGAMCSVCGKAPNPKFLPERKGDIKRSVADISLAKRKIGFYPKMDLSCGLKEVLLQENRQTTQFEL